MYLKKIIDILKTVKFVKEKNLQFSWREKNIELKLKWCENAVSASFIELQLNLPVQCRHKWKRHIITL